MDMPWRRIGRAAAGAGMLLTALAWSAGGLAGSDPVATIGRVAASPPDGLRFGSASVTVWTSTEAGGTGAGLTALARQALGSGPGGAASLRSGALGPVRWAEAVRGARWSVVQLTPAARALRAPSTLVVMSGERLALPASLSAGVAALSADVRNWGAPQIAVCAAGTTAAVTSPLALARLLAVRMGAVVTEVVGGPDEADLFARLPGATTVAVAGRPINLEVRVTRAPTGLVVDVASPFVAPAGCTAAGDGAQAA